jgi:hypothetical protein
VKLKKLNYLAFSIVIILLIFNLTSINLIEKELYDTFYAYDVYYLEVEDDVFTNYTLMFNAVSSQNKSYDNNELHFFFKCYDKEGKLINDAVTAIVKKGTIRQYQAYEGRSKTRGLINYCELNFVQIY